MRILGKIIGVLIFSIFIAALLFGFMELDSIPRGSDIRPRTWQDINHIYKK